jgi:hypothetical protein
MKHQRSWSKCLPSFAMQASAPCAQEGRIRFRMALFCEFPERLFELAANYKLRNFQVIYKTPSTCSTLVFNFVKNFFFCHENAIFALAAKIALIRNARNHEDAAQRLQRFAHWEVSFPFTVDLPC